MSDFDAAILTWQALLFLLVVSIMIVVLPRRFAIAPFLVTVILMTIGQQIVIAGCHFPMMRIILFIGWIRVITRGETRDFKLNTIDRAVILWVILSVIIGIIPKSHHPNAVMPHDITLSAITQGAFLFDMMGSYFFARCLINRFEDLGSIIQILIAITVMLCFFITIERTTGRNLFSIFGVVPEITGIRDGRMRCQGPFTHPIHAGNFGATLVPLCIGLLFSGKRLWGAVGVASATFVMVNSASSGPLMAWFCGVLGFGFWKIRSRMRLVRIWGLVFVIVLELSMKAHVWWLMARAGGVVGGGGYWRSKLIDQFVDHFNEWWLIGTNYTAHWSPTGMGLPSFPDMMDITNQFVAEGVNGGLVRLILFIAVLVVCYKRIGQIVQCTDWYDLKERFMFWAMGCALLAYIAAFMSVANSLQTKALFSCLLAFIASTPMLTEDKRSVSFSPAFSVSRFFRVNSTG
jgi:hypothetical protein